MFRVIPGSACEKDRLKYQDSFRQWDHLIDKTVDLFLRLDTRKAEIVATVLFTEKTINKVDITEKYVFDEVMSWKQKRKPPLDPVEVAETVRNLGMLKWFTLKHSVDIPISEEWV